MADDPAPKVAGPATAASSESAVVSAHSIMRADLHDLDVGKHRVPCPACGKGKHDKALSVTVEADHAVWHCFRCGRAGAKRNGRTAHNLAVTRRHAEPLPTGHLTLAWHWRAMWRDMTPVRGTIAEQYLSARRCGLPPEDGALRYATALWHPTGYVGPALVALVTDAVTREPLTLHRTWIKPDGMKADIDPPRLLLGKHRKKGGVIRLWPDESVTTALAIGEGIETMLTVALAYKPVWSAIDAGNLAAFPVLDGVESLLVVADHDDAGLRAAEQCAERWYRARREVRIVNRRSVVRTSMTTCGGRHESDGY